LCRVHQALQDSPIAAALLKLLPWASDGVAIVSGLAPLTKVLTSVLEKFTSEKSPYALGLLAVTLTYQRSAGLALTRAGRPDDRVPFHPAIDEIAQKLAKFELSSLEQMNGFSLECPLAHPFIWQADEALSSVVHWAGYSERQWRMIQRWVHEQFTHDLVEILSHGESAERFAPFRRLLQLGSNSPARTALNAHMERQRWLLEERPVLNREPFALRDVFVDMECGTLTWKDFLRAKKDAERFSKEVGSELFDPFMEAHGSRNDLLRTVLEYLGDPRFNDAIVIQMSHENPFVGRPAHPR
jgi:hypothetical protein